jgi:hypothetical protein
VVNQSLVLRINIRGKNRQLLVAAKRYRQVQKTPNTDQFATKIKMKANTQAAHLQIAQADTRPKFAKELFFPTNRQQCN